MTEMHYRTISSDILWPKIDEIDVKEAATCHTAGERIVVMSDKFFERLWKDKI